MNKRSQINIFLKKTQQWSVSWEKELNLSNQEKGNQNLILTRMNIIKKLKKINIDKDKERGSSLLLSRGVLKIKNGSLGMVIFIFNPSTQ